MNAMHLRSRRRCSINSNLTASSIGVGLRMDLFQHRYYRLSQILMLLIGQWPYQGTRIKYGILAVIIILGTSQFIPQSLAVFEYRNDWNMLQDCLPLHFFDAICFTKFVFLMWNSQNTLKLLSRIRTNWQVWAQDREVNILHAYAQQGEKIVVAYTAMTYFTGYVYLTQPVVPKIVDVLLKNGTEPGKFPYPVIYYYIDEQKYYFYIILLTFVSASAGLTVLIASDIMLIIFVQHVCGIFAAVGQKLERIKDDDTSTEANESPHVVDKRDIVHLTSCISRHNDALEYANLLEATYTWTLLIVVGLGMILINATGLQILIRTNDPGATARFVLVALSITFYFYIQCYVSQILMDHSVSIRFHIHNSEWYKLSPKAQKLLQFVTMRCTAPCQLTVGKMLIMSVRTFWLTVKTTISFFTFVRSTQAL